MYNEKLFKAYLNIVNNPSPELQKEFDAELEFLKSFVNEDSHIVEFGSGNGRIIGALAEVSHLGVSNGTDICHEALVLAKKKYFDRENLFFQEGNVLDVPYLRKNFANLVFSNYNFVGAFEKYERQTLINRMASLCAKGGRIINITWNDSKKTTKFIKKHHNLAGLTVLKINNNKTITDQGTFYRIPDKELMMNYYNAGLILVSCYQVGNVWKAIVGVKQ